MENKIQLEEKKKQQIIPGDVSESVYFQMKDETKKQIYDLLDDSLVMVQDLLGDMQRKRKTKGIENMWLVSENLAKVKTLVDDRL
jgi:hypothetical protein